MPTLKAFCPTVRWSQRRNYDFVRKGDGQFVRQTLYEGLGGFPFKTIFK